MLISNLKLSDADFTFIDALLNVLNQESTKSDAARNIKEVIQHYENVAINGLIRNLVLDVECHFGIFTSKHNDFRLRNPHLTFEEVTAQLISHLHLVRNNTSFEDPKSNYEVYQRWINANGIKIEVETLMDDPWNFTVFQDASTSNYYLQLILNISAACWTEVFPVEPEDVLTLEESLATGDKTEVGKLAERMRNAYYQEHLKKRS